MGSKAGFEGAGSGLGVSNTGFASLCLTATGLGASAFVSKGLDYETMAGFSGIISF